MHRRSVYWLDRCADRPHNRGMSKTKVTATEKSLYVPIYVIRSGQSGLTITCSDSKYGFKTGTTPEQLQKFRGKLEALFEELVERKPRSGTILS